MCARHLRLFGFASFCVLLCLYAGLWILEREGKGAEDTIFSRDFTAYYAAGDLALRGEIARVYDQEYIWRHVNELLKKQNPSQYYFLYPPFVVWFCAPLALASRDTAAAAAFMLNLGLAFWLAFRLPKKFGLASPHSQAARWLYLGCLPLWATLFNGQNGNLSVAIAAGIFLFWKNGRPFAAGLLLAAGLYKPQLFPGIFFWSLCFGNRRLWAGFCTGATLLLIIGSLAGFQLWMEWWRSTRYVAGIASNPGALYSLKNLFDFWSATGTWHSPGWLFFTLWTLLASLFGLACFQLKRRLPGQPWTAETGYALAIIASIVLTPRIYHYDLPLLFPALILLAKNKTHIPLWLPVVLALSFYLHDLALLARFPLVPALLSLTLAVLSIRALLPAPIPPKTEG